MSFFYPWESKIDIEEFITKYVVQLTKLDLD